MKHKLALIIILAIVLIFPGSLNAATWTQANTDGFGDANNQGVNVLASFNGYLYAGTQNGNTGTEIWRSSNGTTWTQSNADAFGDLGNVVVSDACVFDSRLFVGATNITTGVEVWSTDGEAAWRRSSDDGFGDATNIALTSCATFGDYLYFGTQRGAGGQIWRTNDGSNWTQVGGDIIDSDLNNSVIGNLVNFGSYIYATTTNAATGAEIWRSSNGTDWTQVNTGGFGDAENSSVFGGAIFNSELYFGDSNGAGAHLWKSANGTTWTEVPGYFNTAANTTIYSYLASEGTLYIGTLKMTGAEVWSTTNGTTWTQETSDGFGDATNTGIYPTVAFNNYAYAVTSNLNDGGEVWRAAIPDITDPSFEDLPDSDQPINITEGQTITINPFTIQVAPSDYRGIDKVEFRVDDTLLCTDTEADDDGVYSCDWDTATYHSVVEVTAYDDSDNTSTITRNTTVQLASTDTTITTLPETGMK